MISLPVVIFFITLGVIWWLNRSKDETKKGKAIPGPMGIPLLGNVLQIGSEMHVRFSEWADKYGDIFKVRLGNRLAIVVSDPKMMKEIFTGEPAFAGRQFFEGLEMYPGEALGCSEGELWEVHRRFLLRQLRDFGFGKSSMEQLIMDEVNETIARFKTLKSTKKSIDNTKEIFLVAVINSLWQIVTNTRFKHDDPKLLGMMADSDRLTLEITNRAIFFLVPWTRYFLPKLKDFEAIRDRNAMFYKTAVDEHKATYEEGTLRDFIDVYLAEMNAQKDNPQSMFYGEKAERQLHNILADLHFAGSDTTSTTLTWSVLCLAKFKKVQEKMQNEITAITGDSRPVSVSDRPGMPYTLAVMDEIMRISSIVPTGVQHRAMEGKDFKGYFIPKDTWIFPNLHYLHHNPSIWGDPKNFRPERFLSADGLTYKKNDNLMPFQVGRRQCVGETLARDTFFLFLTGIFQKFSISLDPNAPEPNLEPRISFILIPQPFSVVLEERN